MKNLKTILASVLFATVIGLGAAASAQSAVPGYATVVRVQGLASYTLGDGKWRPLLPGKLLPAGSAIRTGDNGSVDVVLGKEIDFPQSQKTPDRISQAPDAPVRGMISYKPAAEQNVIRLTSGTTIAIDKLTTTDTGADTVSDTELDLQQGKIFASVKKLSATSQYLVKIPNGIAGVRGTLFSISADGGVAVFESTGSGLVLSVTLGGVTKTFLVAPGQILDPSTGGPTSFPAGLDRTLSNIFTALKTIYVEVVNYDENHNNGHVSSTTGHFNTDSQPISQ
jgi:FecR protein